MSDAWAVRIPIADRAGKALNSDGEGRPAPKVILGLDPGSEGFCVALSLVNDRAKLWALPTTKLEGVPVINLREVFRTLKVPPVCFVERVVGRGGWGASQNFNFGAAAGGAVSLLVDFGWDVRLVRPADWQRSVHQSKGGDAKLRSQDAYRRLFPHDPLPKNRCGNINHNALDALLIATYGAASLGYEPRPWFFT